MDILEKARRWMTRRREEIDDMSENTGSPNRMSHDRVRFVLPRRYKVAGMEDVLRRAFNMDSDEQRRLWACSPDGGLAIECRPSQFARFMIYRAEVISRCHSTGLVNGFTDLRVKLIEPEPAPSLPVEVWKRPHQRC